MPQAVPPDPAADRNLLFGVLALQADLLDAQRFAEACSAWAARKETPLASLLVERGWLTPEDRAGVEQFLQRKLKKHAGDVRASLAEVLSAPVRETLSGVADPVVHQTLSAGAPRDDLHEKATVNYQPAGRERYTLTRLHARGGIGQVWLARDGDLGRDVALKELLSGSGDHPAVVARFVEEAKITGQLEHPNIVPVYELARPSGAGSAPFYTMRFVRGRTLAAAIKEYHGRRRAGEAGPLEQRELLGHFVAICNALSYAHSRGVLHRDLKPGNVILGDYGEVVVLDWGLAKLKGEAEPQGSLLPVSVNKESSREGTMQGQAMGTPSYMPPEQAEGRLDLIDERSDVYGLGAILYDLLTGEPPFDGPDTPAILMQVLADTPEPPRRKVPETPRPLEAVCLKALAKKPADRYGSVKELAGEVQRYLADEPVSSYRERLPARARRWVKRHRTLATSAAAVLVAALAGLGVVLAVQARSNRELAAANRRLGEANEREAQRFDLALEAVGTFRTSVGDDPLVKQDQFRGLRDKLLGGAATFYRKLEKLIEGQPDARSQRALGKASFELAQLLIKMGSYKESLEAAEQSREIRQRLADADPDDAGYQSDLAQSHEIIGPLLTAMGKTPQAEQGYRTALAIRQKLADADPGNTEFQRDLAASQIAYAGLLSQMRKPEEAQALYRKSLAIRQKLADAHPDNAAFQDALADSQQPIAYYLANTPGKTQEALAEYEKVLATRRKLVEADPDGVRAQLNLASSYLFMASLLRDAAGRPEESLARTREALPLLRRVAAANPDVMAYQFILAAARNNMGCMLGNVLARPEEGLAEHRQAREIYQKLVENHPAHRDAYHALACSHTNAADCLLALGRRDEARKGFEQGVAMHEKLLKDYPALPLYRRDLGYSLNHFALTRAPAEAAAGVRQARELYLSLPARSPTEWAELASSHALLAGLAAKSESGVTAGEGRASADAAMDALRQAVKNGFRSGDTLRVDPAYAVLRRRDDFQALLKDLEAKLAPKTP